MAEYNQGYAQQQPGYVQQQPGYGQQQPGYGQPQPVPVGNTTVVITQPTSTVIQVERDWNTGLCGCFEDVTTCCAVYWCMPFYQCYLSDLMGEGVCMPCCVPYAIPALRLKLRTQQNIRGSILKDCCAAEFCGPCTLCQTKREFDMVRR